MEQKTGWRSRNSQTWFKPVLILTLIVWISACQQIEPGPNPTDTAIIPAATQSAYSPPVLTIPPYIPPSFQTLTPTPQPTRTLRLSLTPPVTPIPTTPILETFPSAAALKSGGLLIETGDLTHTLWYANPDGSGEQALGVGFDRYSLSPNQKEALLIRSGGLWLSVLGSNTAKEILPASPQYGDVVTATFSPDEHWIALAYQKHYQADSPEPTHIVVIDSQTKAVKFEHDQKFSGFSLGWTPDSQGLMVQQIGLSVLPIFSAGKPEMKEISGDCGSLVLVTPEWTPDGKLIIYTVYGNGRGAMGKVCVINPETANVSQVQAGGSVEGSAVNPGSRFLYLAVMNPDYDNQGIDPD